jgi:hypothetical protein
MAIVEITPTDLHKELSLGVSAKTMAIMVRAIVERISTTLTRLIKPVSWSSSDVRICLK